MQYEEFLQSKKHSPVSMGRKAIGIELKDSYYRQAIKNIECAKDRFKKTEQLSIIDIIK